MMSLRPGTRLGPYEIAGLLGAGGMGEVYRARDTKLQRDVAVKVLPEDVTSNAERLGRFRREAHLLAALNHPNIAAIYGLEDSGPRLALVMELVEGPTLREQLARGPLPVGETLPMAQQIAEGLEYAHERGIIHRDLKPANIKITPEGKMKVLDFGLGKAFAPREASPEGASEDPTQSPTLTAPATRSGVILGTAAYMAPEQARGRRVDRRADIWSFGCVLYEMLTGRRAFQGETVSDTLAALLKAEPDWDALPEEVGPHLRDLLERCLRKDPGRRLRDIGDARLEIEAAIAAGPSSAAAESGRGLPGARGVSLRQKIAWGTMGAVLAALAAVALALSGSWLRGGPQQTPPLRLSILHTEGSEVGAPAISPDGNRIAYRARRADGMPLLWIRDLDSFEARPLAGTEDAYLPFWSPDSRQLAYVSGGFLKRIPAEGGPAQIVAPVGSISGGAWAPDDTIVFNPDLMHLFRVSAAGGEATPVTTTPSQDWTHQFPSFLPDGRRFLFTAKLWTRSAESSEQGIYLGSLDSPVVRRLLPDLSSAVYAPPGYIVFARDGVLTTAPFDSDTGVLTGEPTSLGESVAFDSVSYLAAVSAAADGTLALRPAPTCALSYITTSCDAGLRLVDRAGRVILAGAPRRYTYYMALAPDGHRVAVDVSDPLTGTSDLWLVDMQTDTRSPLTATRGDVGSPVWSPDGSHLAYAYQPPGQLDDVYLNDLRTGKVTPVIESPGIFEHPVAWSHDAAHLLVHTWEDPRAPELKSWTFASRTLTPFVEFLAEEAVFSPDDRSVAFSSQESGRYEVYVTTYPGRRQTWPVTTEGGRVLSWRADGRELLIATLSGDVAAYPVSTEGGFSVGKPTILIRNIGSQAPYSRATPDHSRILIRVNADAEKDRGEIRLLFGWAEALRKDR